MTPRFLAFMPFIFEWEGERYENDPDDPGGETKFGIDKRSHPTVNIRELTKEGALQIYHREYWLAQQCDELPKKVGEVVMNIGVNAGKGRAAKWLQQAINATGLSLGLAVVVDGNLGPKTLAAATLVGPPLATALLDRTEAHYRSIARGSLAKYLRGWLNRNNALRTRLA